MSEPREFDFYPVETCGTVSGEKAQSSAEISKTETCGQNHSLRGQRLCWRDPVSRKSTTGLVAQMGGNHTEIWIHSSELHSLERWRSGVLRFGERRSSWTTKGIRKHGSGNSNEADIQSDNSTANSLTDRSGAGPRTKHIDTRYYWVQERVQDGDLRIKKVRAAKKLCRCWNEACLCFCTTKTLQVCRIAF